jgi:putative oxidoreductase
VSVLPKIESVLARTRRAAFIALWILLIVQVIWTTYVYFRARFAAVDLLYPLVFVPAAALLVITRGRVRWVAAIPRLLIGTSFVYNVADRLGFLGAPGTKNVSWGDFQHFIAYTAQVNAFAPPSVIPALAVLATIGEGTLGLAMLLGIRTRVAAAGSAMLLTVFATAMVLSGLSQLQYNVCLMAAAAWFIASIDRKSIRPNDSRGSADSAQVDRAAVGRAGEVAAG